MSELESLKVLIRMFIERNQGLWERLESLEHLTNQHDILIIGLLNGISQSDVYKHLDGKLKEKSHLGLESK